MQHLPLQPSWPNCLASSSSWIFATLRASMRRCPVEGIGLGPALELEERMLLSPVGRENYGTASDEVPSVECSVAHRSPRHFCHRPHCYPQRLWRISLSCLAISSARSSNSGSFFPILTGGARSAGIRTAMARGVSTPRAAYRAGSGTRLDSRVHV